MDVPLVDGREIRSRVPAMDDDWTIEACVCLFGGRHERIPMKCGPVIAAPVAGQDPATTSRTCLFFCATSCVPACFRTFLKLEVDVCTVDMLMMHRVISLHFCHRPLGLLVVAL